LRSAPRPSRSRCRRSAGSSPTARRCRPASDRAGASRTGDRPGADDHRVGDADGRDSVAVARPRPRRCG
jgi:hypothetical protein